MPTYPFAALVGQEQMQLALLLNAVNPRLGGVLIRGQKGTAKSTAARGLAELLPPVQVVAACDFGCDPTPGGAVCQSCAERQPPLPAIERPVKFVELPIGATEDRVLGTLDLEHALREGRRAFEPGLLARANRGVLYVDEVNLLPDHLVDSLLDAAAMGVNSVEREGISFTHPAQFVLVGTMNPEEGELRPQLLDRFGLTVDVSGSFDATLRAEIVRRRIAFERDAAAFAVEWAAAGAELRRRIAAARSRLPSVVVDESMIDLIARLCAELDVDGLRADIVTYKTAATLAALDGRARVTVDDVRHAIELAIPHRRRRQPFDQTGLDSETLDRLFQQHLPPDELMDEPHERDATDEMDELDALDEADEADATDATDKVDMADEADEADEPPPGLGVPRASGPQPQPNAPSNGASGHADAAPRTFEVGSPPPIGSLLPRASRRNADGRLARQARATPRSDAIVGRYVRGAPPKDVRRFAGLDIRATLCAAAPFQRQRGGQPGALRLTSSDLRQKVRQPPAGACVLFVVDASGSMAARRRMAAAKAAIVSLMSTAYLRRDRVGLICFRGASANLVLPPTNSVDLAHARLSTLPTGGRTPLASALRLAETVLSRAKRSGSSIVVLVSDGRANVGLLSTSTQTPFEESLAAAETLRASGVTSLVVDTEDTLVRLNLATRISQALGGQYLRLADLNSAAPLTAAVLNARNRSR